MRKASIEFDLNVKGIYPILIYGRMLILDIIYLHLIIVYYLLWLVSQPLIALVF